MPPSLLIAALEAPDLAVVRRQGDRNPAVGPFLSRGSHVSLFGLPTGRAALDSLAAAAAAAARRAGLPFETVDAATIGKGGAGPSVRWLPELLPLAGFPVTTWEQELESGTALTFAVLDGRAATPPLAVVCSLRLPSLGGMPPASLAALEETWTRIAGGPASNERYLLDESWDAFDPEAERRLTDRLRQLYGE